jgi:prevent-host-death family protein
MERRTTVYEASQQFDEILREVADRENSYVLERSGEAVVAVVPMRVYEDWQRQQALDLLRQAQRNAGDQNELLRKRKELFDLIHQAQENLILTDEVEVQQIVDEAIHEVRAEMKIKRAMAAPLIT